MESIAGEVLTVWYAGSNPDQMVPFRARVKQATQKRGLEIEYIDLKEDDSNKNAWLDPETQDWLIGDWLTHNSKDEASHDRAGQRADAITARLRAAAVRGKDSAQATCATTCTRTNAPHSRKPYKPYPHAD